MTTQNKIEQLLNLLPHKSKVEFAVFCANDVKHLMTKESVHCLEITEKWLKDSTSVSNDELRNAAYDAAYNAAYHAANTAYAAAYAAAYDAYDASAAAYAAANAANSAANAANSAANTAAKAADATIYAANTIEQTKLIYYYNHLISMYQNLTEFEKVFYNIKEL